MGPVLVLQLRPPAIILPAHCPAPAACPIWIELWLFFTVTPPETVVPQTSPGSFPGRFWIAKPPVICALGPIVKPLGRMLSALPPAIWTLPRTCVEVDGSRGSAVIVMLPEFIVTLPSTWQFPRKTIPPLIVRLPRNSQFV